MLIFIFIFLLSIAISFFLLDDISFYNFIHKQYINIFISFLIYIMPKVIFFINMPFLLDFAFCITIITDIIDYSVFSIIPSLLIIISFIYNILYGYYDILYYSLVNTVAIYIFFSFLILLIKKLFKKDGLGLGDLYFYFIIAWYFDLYFLLLSFLISSLVGLFFIIFYKLIFFEKDIKRMIPFIPCLYIGVSLLKVNYIYKVLFEFIFAIN